MINNNHPFFLNKPLCNLLCDRNYKPIEGSNFKSPYDVRLPSGKYNLSSCREFECLFITISTQIEKSLKKFPDCCQDHAKMKNEVWFRKEDFSQLPWQIADKVMYSYLHILNHIDNENWYKDITDYIDYIIESFGSLPYGYGEPLYLSMYFSYMNELRMTYEDFGCDPKKVSLLYNYLKEKSDDGREVKKPLDPMIFNILSDTYNKWMDLFPFEFTFFQNLKEYFKDRAPILHEHTSYNPYTNTHRVKLKTQKELIKTLGQLTNSVLASINTVKMVQENQITDVEKIKIDLINQEHQSKQRLLLSSDLSKGEKKYANTIKEWLKNESKFFEKLSPLLKPQIEKNNLPVDLPPLAFMLKGPRAKIKDKAIDLHDSLALNGLLPLNSKKDFIKLFTGQNPISKIPWLGLKGELKVFVDLLLSNDKIEDCQNTKWKITASSFTFNEEEFTPLVIGGTKNPKNITKIIQIVKNIY